eukprot:TRINITY_DN2396_c1_g1_i6.p1 TRINITY_DN2396_c1_g1~~TRINITY_DN2396_c1_g1_i6.p1  ORF type:complete len:192 (-),score=16.61 TRINITY_DN2396_c1_g1_i6:135-710(-)
MWYMHGLTSNSHSPQNMYTVSSSHKQWVLRKANATWKNWKSSLRRNVYDKYLTDAERRAHVPPYVRQEDWEIFVDMCSTPEVQASREMGRAAKSASRSPHTSGRKGQAGVVEELRQQNLDKEVSCTYIWIATHTRKGGLVSSQQLVRTFSFKCILCHSVWFKKKSWRMDMTLLFHSFMLFLWFLYEFDLLK